MERLEQSGEIVKELSRALMLGSLLEDVRRRWGAYELVDHWQQGEFHHDVVVRVPRAAQDLGGDILIVATNCNGGVKEVLSFRELPSRLALWHWRCPENPDFGGAIPALLGTATTEHWFDPCELLTPNARSEYRAEHRERQCGGGWLPRK
jgi:hypothetical protein